MNFFFCFSVHCNFNRFILPQGLRRDAAELKHSGDMLLLQGLATKVSCLFWGSVLTLIGHQKFAGLACVEVW
jgi:hypothetical protein